MKKFSFLFLSLIVVLSFTLAACSSGKSGSNSSGSSQSTLVFGRGADSTSLDPAVVTDGESFKVTKNIYDTIVGYKGQTTKVGPDLAKSWEITNGGKTYTFHLQSGIKFQDGTDFNAKAVVYNFNRWMNGKASGKFAYFGSMFGGFKGDPGACNQKCHSKGSSNCCFPIDTSVSTIFKRLGDVCICDFKPNSYPKVWQ